MSGENRNSDTGQFEVLYGQQASEAEAGYKPMPSASPVKSEPDDLDFTPREASEILTAARGDEAPVIPVTYRDVQTGEPRDSNETVSLEQAAHDLTAWRQANEDSRAASVSKDFAAEVDKLRAPQSDEGNVAETAPPEKPAKEPAEKPADEPSESGLDQDLERALKHPQVRHAVEEELTKASDAHRQYSEGLRAGQQMLQATVASLAPQLQGLPVEQWGQALATMAQTDPFRANLVAETLNKWGTLQQAEQQNQQHRAHIAQQQFETARKELASASVKALSGYSEAEQQAAADWLTKEGSRFGVTKEQLASEARGNLLFAHPLFQTVLMKAAAYDRMKSAPLPKPAQKTLPPVQRPGTAAPRQSHNERSASAALEKFNKTGSLKDAAEALAARRARS